LSPCAKATFVVVIHFHLIELLLTTAKSNSTGFRGESHRSSKPLGTTTQNPHLGKSRRCFEIRREVEEALEKR